MTGERLSQLLYPFAQLDCIPQLTSVPPFPLGSNNFFGLNYDLSSLPLLEQNGETCANDSSASEPEFKRPRLDPPLGKV